MLVGLGTASCNNNKASAPELKTVKVQFGGQVVDAAVRAADDPQNPHAAGYAAWDWWALDNLRDVNDPDGGSPDSAARNILVAFDKDGFMLPALEVERLIQENLAGKPDVSGFGQLRYTDARGRLDEAVWDAYHEELDKLVAAYYPAVPAWLVAAPPVRARLLPNGNVATYGPLGSGSLERGADKAAAHGGGAHGSDESATHMHNWHYMTQYLYDSAGAVLGQSNLSVTPLLEELPGRPLETGGGLNMTKLGYAYFIDQDSGGITSVWDYDGAYLGTALPDEEKPRQPFSTLEGWQLKKLYNVQNS